MQDGVEQSSGRGAGRDELDEGKKAPLTPFMQMTYWMNERRLDTAIFRSLFASSLRQARQMVVHGHVKVNGKRVSLTMYLGFVLGKWLMLLDSLYILHIY